MQKYLNYFQPQMIKYDVSFNEGAVLDYIMKANTWANTKKRWEQTFFQVNSWKIMDDLPILWIKTKSWILRMLAWLVKKWLLERYSTKEPFFAWTELLKDYIYAWGGDAIGVSPSSDTSITVAQYNSNVNNSNAKYIYISANQVKEKRSSAISDIKKMLYSLEGENLTDLGDVDYIDVINLWNSMSWSLKLKKVMIKEQPTWQMRLIRESLKKLAREYTKEEFNNWLKNYMDDIKGRPNDPNPNSYSNHRFWLVPFLTQANWIKKFIFL